MTAIREKVDLEIASKYINGQKVDIFTEEVPINDLPNSLKREMLYIMDGMKDKKKPKDYDEEDLNFLADDKGNLKGYHYIRAGLSDGESKKYIYDEERDVIYKVKGTRILGTTLHTYEYACKLKGVPFRDIGNNLDYIINKGSVMVRTGNIAYYGPDLENFRTGVLSIVYHKKNKTTETKEVPYYLSGISPEVTINQGILGREQTYVWYDYSQDSKMWANVKCESANEIVSYWTWIPRYAYKITERKTGEIEEDGSVDIKFVDVNNRYYDSSSKQYKNLESGYTVASAFEQNGKHLKGIWMSKYEPSMTELGFKPSTDKEAVNPPDLSNFNKDKTFYVTYKNNGIKGDEVLTSIKEEQPADWYDYTASQSNSKRWANIKCINSDNNDKKEIISYWVWVPRYAYRVEQGQVQIIYVDTENKPLDKKYEELFTIGTDDNCDFRVLAAFDQNNQHLSGIWMSKYEPSHLSVDGFKLSNMENPKEASNAPDLSNFNPEKTYYVTYANNGTSGNEIATLIKDNNEPENWYDYTQKKWANVKCVNTSEATGKDLVSYWTWVPSYAYRVVQGQLEVIYVRYDNTSNKWVPCDSKYNTYTIGTGDKDFKVLAAFEQNNQHLNGIWMSKYEPSMISNEFENSKIATAVNAPDLSNFNPAKTYYIQYLKNNNNKEYEKATIVQGNNAPTDWYDYTQKKWANIKCVNTVNGKDLVSYWTWVPSYAYRVTQGQLEVIYVRYDNTTNKWVPCDSNYNNKYTIGTDGNSQFRVLAAFEQNGQHLDGIWMSKYEPSKIDK